jgi:hypothetical protein
MKTSEKISRSIKLDLDPKISILITCWIILQYFFFPAVFSLTNVAYTDFIYLQSIGFYLLIALSVIFINHAALDVFRDYATLLVIAISCFLPLVFAVKDSLVFRSILTLPGLILIFYILLHRKLIKFPAMKSFIMGLVLSAASVVAIALMYVVFDKTYNKTIPPNALITIFGEFVYQLPFVSVIEETLFRGLILSLLIASGYKEKTVLIFQALLFWGIHYNEIIIRPYVFFLVIPAVTFCLTFTIKKYKMLYLCIMIHTCVNLFAAPLAVIINQTVR